MPFLRFTLRQLETFLTVAETHSFTHAGERLGLTPSAVSQLVQELESVLGFRLFDRSTRRVSLSVTGKEFLNSAGAVLKRARQAETIASAINARATGVVRIAAPMVIAGVMLPTIIKAYRTLQPEVAVRIMDCPVERLIDMVIEGDADMSVGPNAFCSEEIISTVLFESPWVLWCTPDHALAQFAEVSWDDLRRFPLVAAGRDHEQNVARMGSALPVTERITPVDVVDNISTALGIASSGLAVTLSPAYVELLAKPFGLVMRRIVAPDVVRQVCLYRSSTFFNAPAAEGFAEHLIGWIAENMK
ncbi:LysR family transcriptional regulator [Leclercia adecarboxylata]|uniref:LysR family transcriptional regulator n=1 Tax=Leclercia adecarboxylata TaxID=83655 RepID=UPI002DBD2801|nr:LysR family transcriptional regulator [Leclercia adecarboxylata]MEB6377817.1 LysR family transcriptional regulator [Leclercia adecarboxylata]